MSAVLSPGAVSAGAAGYLATFVLLQYSGLMGPLPFGIIGVLHLWPALGGIMLLMLAGIADSMKVLRSRKGNSGSLGANLIGRLLCNTGIVLMGAGICISSITRFEGRLILTEGQEIGTLKEGLDTATLYARKFSRMPVGGVFMQEVSPFMTEDGKLHKRLSAGIVMRDGSNPAGRELSVNSIVPLVNNGFFYWIEKQGYSPYYRLFEANGTMIDEVFIVTHITPPGREDSFRMTNLPHTFYLRYYPEASMVPDKALLPQGKKGPLFMVRVVRNLDLVANTYASPNDVVKFDELLVTFGDMRRWAEILIVWDPGQYLMVPGIIMLMAGGLVIAIKRVRQMNMGDDAATTLK